MSSDVLRMLRQTPIFRALADDDLARVAEVSEVRLYERGDQVFAEGDPPDHFFTVVRGRVKVVKMTPAGKDVILEIFGPGDPLGGVAVYEERPFPASAVAIEDTVCLDLPRRELFRLLEEHPSLVRGLLVGLTRRLIELTSRLAELTGGKVEPRFARLFLKLADERGRPVDDGIEIPLALTRQELADLTGTTVETSIRIMSRWGKEGVVRTDDEGFTVLDRPALEMIALN